MVVKSAVGRGVCVAMACFGGVLGCHSDIKFDGFGGSGSSHDYAGASGIFPSAGSLANAGSGSTGGGGKGVGSGVAAGSGGAAGMLGTGSAGQVAMAGAGGVHATAGGASGAAGTGANACPTQYTVATHITIDVSWDGTLALTADSGQVHLWTMSKFVETGEGANVQSVSCGSVLPVVKTTMAAGNAKILPEIPEAAWDSPNMPKFGGTATRSGNTTTINSDPAIVGATLAEPNGAWPAAAQITSADHDGDNAPGLTAIPKDGNGYAAPPTNFTQSARADRLYLAIRNVMSLTTTHEGCPSMYSGTAAVTKFENHVIGCHVKGGGNCTSSERDFVDSNRTIYKLGAATFESKVVDANSTCADVRAAWPM